jgi:hypothetical protein
MRIGQSNYFNMTNTVTQHFDNNPTHSMDR